MCTKAKHKNKLKQVPLKRNICMYIWCIKYCFKCWLKMHHRFQRFVLLLTSTYYLFFQIRKCRKNQQKQELPDFLPGHSPVFVDKKYSDVFQPSSMTESVYLFSFVIIPLFSIIRLSIYVLSALNSCCFLIFTFFFMFCFVIIILIIWLLFMFSSALNSCHLFCFFLLRFVIIPSLFSFLVIDPYFLFIFIKLCYFTYYGFLFVFVVSSH